MQIIEEKKFRNQISLRATVHLRGGCEATWHSSFKPPKWQIWKKSWAILGKRQLKISTPVNQERASTRSSDILKRLRQRIIGLFQEDTRKFLAQAFWASVILSDMRPYMKESSDAVEKNERTHGVRSGKHGFVGKELHTTLVALIVLLQATINRGFRSQTSARITIIIAGR